MAAIRPIPPRRRGGFTILELMIAIAIASFTVTALYGIFTVQSRQFLVQDLQMEMHQNLRFAADLLGRSARMAGFNTAGTVVGVMGLGGDSNDLPVVIPWDADGTTGTDAITIVYGDPQLVMDTRNDRVEPWNTTEIDFRSNMLDYGSKLVQLEAGELLLCFDYADIFGMTSYLWEISADYDPSNPGVVLVYDNSSYSDYAAKFSGGGNLAPVMSCTRGNVFTFYVDADSGDATPGTEDHPVLMLDMDMDWPESDDVPLVDNIEDLQVEYCVDDGTGTVDCSDDANWTDTFSTSDIEHLWMIRISLLARSSREEPNGLYTSSRPALANHSAGSSTDHYFREVLVTEVTVRNLRYQDTMPSF